MSDDLPPMARPRVAAGVLIHDKAGRVLLVKPSYKDGWDLPGGYVEPNETPVDAVLREVLEELNASFRIGRLLVCDWAPHPDEGDKLLFIFDGGVMTTAEIDKLLPDGSEILEARFYDRNQLKDVTPSRLTKRISLALQVADAGQLINVYAEHGERRRQVP